MSVDATQLILKLVVVTAVGAFIAGTVGACVSKSIVNGALATVLFVIPALTASAFTVAVLLTVKGVLLYNVEDVVGSTPFVV